MARHPQAGELYAALIDFCASYPASPNYPRTVEALDSEFGPVGVGHSKLEAGAGRGKCPLFGPTALLSWAQARYRNVGVTYAHLRRGRRVGRCSVNIRPGARPRLTGERDWRFQVVGHAPPPADVWRRPVFSIDESAETAPEAVRGAAQALRWCRKAIESALKGK